MMPKKNGFKPLIIYCSLAMVIMLTVYNIPTYYFLKSSISTHASSILSFLGVTTSSINVDGHVFLGKYEIIRDCTGIQVMAVFLGLILPLPKVSWKKKTFSLIMLGVLLYAANIFRVVLEYWLVDTGLLPWSLAHYPLSLILGIVGVCLLVVINHKIVPEFGDYIYAITQKIGGFAKRL